MTAKRLFYVCLAVAMVSAATAMRAQDAAKTNDAAIEELKQEKQAAAAVAPATEPVVDALQPAPAPKAEAPKPQAPVIEELLPAAAPVAAEKKPAAPAIEELVPAKAPEAPAVAPAAPAAEPAKAVEAPATAPVVAETPKADQPNAEAPAPAAAANVTQLGQAERVDAAKVLENTEVVRRAADLKGGLMSLEAGDKAWSAKDYPAALDAYKKASASLSRAPDHVAERARAKDRIPQCEYQVALGLMKAGKNGEALAKATDASKRFPEDKNLKGLQVRLERIVAGPTDTGTTDTTKPVSMSEVDRQMLEGKKAIANRDYAKARASFESVLAIERDNREAMHYLKEVGDLQYNTASLERSATAKKMSAAVRDTWNPPQYKMLAATKPTTNAPAGPDRSDNILKKMERIVIPEIEFRQANIHDVVDFLNKASVEADKQETDPSRRGINIILNLSPAGSGPAVTAPAAGGDGLFEAEPAKGGGGGGGGQSYEITFTARYITLLSALKIITQVAGLRYRVDGNIVMIVPADYDPAQIEVRMYPVEPTFITRIAEARQAMPAASNTKTIGGREVTGIQEQELGNQVADLKSAFEAMGVKFPKGSSITYNSAIGKVIVGNTAENLAVFEKLLAELNVVPKQVEIEARFVEVNETDLKELGLEWLLNDNWELAQKNTGAYTPLAASQRVVVNNNATSGGFTRGLRFWGSGSSGADDTLGAGAGTKGAIAKVSSILTNPELSMVLHALEQNGNADLLSAPKVTTRSGTEASIRVVTEYIYPTTFEVQGGQINNNNNNSNSSVVQETVVVPQDFATREVGVILTVLPEVSPDGNMINLTMTPSVVTEPTWYQYGSTIRRADGSEQQLNMPQPFFHMRTLTTQISIYDGATVVMGGLITEDLRKVNDRIPILGDIPLIGALFRSQSENSVKKNLMIFVTAKLVDPAGKSIRNIEGEKGSALAPAVPAAVPN